MGLVWDGLLDSLCVWDTLHLEFRTALVILYNYLLSFLH